MDIKLKRSLKFLGFLSVSVLLFWLIYRDQDWEFIYDLLREDVNYFWIWITVIVGTLSHISRALRWQLLTASMGKHISFTNSLLGVMIGYFANMAIPRMGEFTRCGVVSKYEDVSFSKLLGTVVTERIIDLIILLALILVVAVTQFKQIGIFLENNKEVKDKLYSFVHSWWLLVAFVVFLLLLLLLLHLLRRTKFRKKLNAFGEGLKEGLLSVRNVKKKKLFIFHSLFIWLMYFLMFYLCFFAFEFTSHLSALVGLTLFVAGSLGMVAPVQGGIGAWHFMVIAGLLVYLPDYPNIETLAKVFALLTHGAMTLYYIVFGSISVLILPIYNARRKKRKNI